jgi:hypothetical protein
VGGLILPRWAGRIRNGVLQIGTSCVSILHMVTEQERKIAFISFSEYIQEAMRFQGLHPELRAGQSFSNVLNKIRPDLADAVISTEVDPFYNNDNLNKFFEFLLENW